MVGGDRETDIAVLKLNVGDRTNKYGKPVSIEESRIAPSTYKYQQGEEVFAIGNPSGKLPMTYLDGVISYDVRDQIRLEPAGYLKLLQHSCLTTHGSSGGGLFNMKGQLIGITNAGNDEFKGMNYAIPLSGDEGFVEIATKLILTNTDENYGYVSGRWNLGVIVKTAQTEINGSKIVIDSVDQNGNSFGKLQEGDYVTGIKCFKKGYETLNYDIKTESDFKEVVYLLREYVRVNDTVQITIARRSVN